MMFGPGRVLHRATVVLLGLSCAPAPEPTPPAEQLPRVSPDAELLPSRPRAPLGTGELLQLEVPGFGPAVFFAPAGLDARPLLVAAHGAGGTPEWECEYWRRLTNDRAF